MDTKTSLASLPSCSKLHFVVEFTFGFKKNERLNINNVELANLMNIAEFLLDLTSEQIDKLIYEKMLMEVKNDNDKK